MRGLHFVVSIRDDQHQVPHIGLGEKILDRIERGRIEPLQIVEEQSQRMLRPREHSDESPKDELESALGALKRKVGDRWRFADDELQFRYKVHDELPVRTERIMKRIAPCGQFVFTLTQERTDKALEGLGGRRIRNVALVLIECARREKSARRHADGLQRVASRGL